MKKLLFILMLLFVATPNVTAQDEMEQTEAPWIQIYTAEMFFHFGVEVGCYSDSPDVVIYFRYQYGYGYEDFTDWMEVSSGYIFNFNMGGRYIFQAYAVEPGKLPSEIIEYYFYNEFDLYRTYIKNYDFIVDDIYYETKTDSTVAVSMEEIETTSGIGALIPADYDGKPCKSYSGDVVIPPTVDYNGKTYMVTGINSESFLECELSNVEMPNTITWIGNLAFYGSTVSNFVLSESLTYLGDAAFAQCRNLTEIVIPNTVTSLPYGLFFGCDGLTDVVIGNSVTSIGQSAFYCCEGLTSMTIPNSVTTIDSWAFGECYGLSSLTIGNSVNTIAYGAFNGCTSLDKVTCLATTPPSVYLESFSNYDSATLFVPNESLEAYQAHEVWSQFSRIVPFLGAGPGDTNGDGSINISDVTNLINDLLSGDNPAYCDVNGDGVVNITDVTVLINLLLSGR